MAHSAAAPVRTFIVASNTQLAAPASQNVRGTFQAHCPYCGETLDLHDERWMIPAHSLKDQPVTDKLQQHVRQLATNLAKSAEVPTLFYSKELNGQDFLSLKELGLHALPSDFEDGSFTGLYQCDACGRSFLTWHSPEDDEIPASFAEVSLTRDGSRVCISFKSKNRVAKLFWRPNEPATMNAEAEFVFDVSTGVILMNGEPQLYSFAQSDCVLYSVLGAYDVYRAVDELLPKGLSLPAWSPLRDNALSLYLAIRFQGYPEAFYQSCSEHFGHPQTNTFPTNYERYDRAMGARRLGTHALFRSMCELPLHYDELPALLARTTLPNVKSLRRLAFENPLIIAAARCSKELPLNDVNMLRAFLSSPVGPGVLSELPNGPKADFWQDFTQAKGQKKTLKVLTGLKPEDIFLLNRIPVVPNNELQDWLNARDCGMSLAQVRELRDFNYLREHGIELSRDYEYTPKQQALVESVEQHEFALPACPIELHGAGEKLHNCLSNWHGSQNDESTVVLVNKGAAARLVAAVEVNLDKQKVLQARLACNEPVPRDGELHDAIGKWAFEHGLEWREAA